MYMQAINGVQFLPFSTLFYAIRIERIDCDKQPPEIRPVEKRAGSLPLCYHFATINHEVTSCPHDTVVGTVKGMVTQ